MYVQLNKDESIQLLKRGMDLCIKTLEEIYTLFGGPEDECMKDCALGYLVLRVADALYFESGVEPTDLLKGLASVMLEDADFDKSGPRVFTEIEEFKELFENYEKRFSD